MWRSVLAGDCLNFLDLAKVQKFKIQNRAVMQSSCSIRHGTTCSGARTAPPPVLFAARSDLLLIFQDCADADNFPAVADLLARAPNGSGGGGGTGSVSIATNGCTSTSSTSSHITSGHVRTRVALCVVGRRAHLGAAPSKPPQTLPPNATNQTDSFGAHRAAVHAAADADDEDADSHLCLLDGARRMRAFLQRVGVWARVDWFVVDPAHFGTARSDQAIIA
jgi:hypothetical protein